MAQRMKKTEVTTTAPSTEKKQPTANEMREWYEKNKKHIENFAAAESAAKSLRDVTKTATKTVTAFSKESLRNYLRNIGSNEKNLRNLSRYLFYRCHAYYRLIMYHATMFDLKCRTVIPQYDLVKVPDVQKTLKSYQETLVMLDEMNLQYEFLKMLAIAFREDVAYGCAYYTEGEGLFILPLDSDYMKIDGVYATGNFSASMDMTYFRSRAYELEAWGEPFQSLYRAYESTGIKFQQLPPEHCVVLKSRPEDWETIVPIFSGLLNSIINLIDLEDIQAIADEQEIYKMIWLEMETLTGADSADEWKVDPSIMIDYFNRMINEALPDYISAAIVPGKLDQITFDSSKVNDTNKISKATETLFNSSGGAQILNSSTISGTTAFTAAIKADTELAISMMLPQIQGWTNMFLGLHLSNPCDVIFHEVSAYTKDDFKKSLYQDFQFGLPLKLTLNTFNGFSERQTLAMNFLEIDCLGLNEKFIPPQSANTQSGSSDTGGAPTKDSGELTDDGESSRDKRDNKK